MMSMMVSWKTWWRNWACRSMEEETSRPFPRPRRSFWLSLSGYWTSSSSFVCWMVERLRGEKRMMVSFNFSLAYWSMSPCIHISSFSLVSSFLSGESSVCSRCICKLSCWSSGSRFACGKLVAAVVGGLSAAAAWTWAAAAAAALAFSLFLLRARFLAVILLWFVLQKTEWNALSKVDSFFEQW